MRFAVWAPAAAQVELWLRGERQPMAAGDRGWWAVEAPAMHGDDYGFCLDGGEPRKDPRSRWQPDGSQGLSRVVAADVAWTDGQWHGRPLAGAVLYELHVGTFTDEGTLDAAIARLPNLVSLGVDAVELLPLNGFAGDRGWGYDGVDLWAVHEAYGGPAALQRFVDAAHGHGLAVVLDVVFNHLGPSGNVLPDFGPYLTEAHTTPWGPAVNLDQPGSDEVRRFIVDCCLHWLGEHHLDGLRLDAVHAFVDASAVHLLEQLSREVADLEAATGRTRWLIAESDRNDPGLVTPRAAGGLGLDAMWADDLHHCVHTVLTGEHEGYYADYGSLADLVRCWTTGLLYDGRWSPVRERTVGRPVPRDLPGSALVVALQNHDQVGNRARGERIASLVDAALARVGAALVLTSPMTPMLFMGEEWGARTPWLYVAGFPDPELAEAVRQGRRSEFAGFAWDDVPDPIDPATFAASRLDWDTQDAQTLRWYTDLLALRRREPALADGRLDLATGTWGEGWVVLRRGAVAVCAVLADEPVDLEVAAEEMLLHSGNAPELGPDRLTVPGRSVAIVRTR